MTIYFYPKLAETNSNSKEIVLYYIKTIIPLFTIGLVIIYFWRKLIIQVLFSSEFETMESLFLWQLLGDLLKAISLIFGTILIANKKTKTFIITEIISLCILYFSSNWMLHTVGINGIVMAHTFTYFMYLLVMFFIFFKKMKS
jgi:PST family polysaccharide transporter